MLSGAHSEPAGRIVGESREGRPIRGHRLGQGDLRLSLIGGCHADEPVGPAMLRRLAGYLGSLPADDPLAAGATWYVVPHVNPDGEARNAAWSDHPVPAVDGEGAPDVAHDLFLYLRQVVRELPGDDMEFGFPRDPDDEGARPENRAVARFLAAGAPFHLHGSFHGIGFSRVDEGFSTRPNSVAMREHFLERGDPEMAAKFRPSSMEYVRSLGGDPFTMVSEMPLFLRPPQAEERGRQDDHHFKAVLGRLALGKDPETVRSEAARLGLRGMPVRDQMRLQLAFLNEAIAAVQAHRGLAT